MFMRILNLEPPLQPVKASCIMLYLSLLSTLKKLLIHFSIKTHTHFQVSNYNLTMYIVEKSRDVCG